jgi:hypothetical protein
MTSQKATLDSMSTVFLFVSCQRLSPQFQFSLSAVTLGIYLGAAHRPESARRLEIPLFHTRAVVMVCLA